MKKLLLILVPLFLVVIVLAGFVYYKNYSLAKGALQVTSKPESNVYLDGKLIGKTPFCRCEGSDMLSVGEYTLRLIPVDSGFTPFEEKIKIGKSVLTVVDRTFESGASSEGSIISLNPLDDRKALELLVLSFPDKTEVLLDNKPSGSTPLILKNLTESDHEIKFIKSGYKEKTIRIRSVAGYKLITTVFLGVNPEIVSESPTPSVSPTIEPTSSVFTKVTILQTPTGFLRVRAYASLTASEIARVSPGEVLELVEESNGWFKIKLADGTLGWISASYAQKQ